MRIGIPKEVKEDEFRVAMTPAGVRELVTHGHELFVGHDAGIGSAFADDEYAAAGATIVDDPDELWARAELVCKVKEPLAPEYHRLRSDLVLFTYLHLAASAPCTHALLDAGTTAIAYETVQRPDGSLPLLAPMSEIAGRLAPIVGAEFLQRQRGGRGVLMGGIAGVRPARVVVIGTGVAGAAAASIAVGMHAEVTAIDRDVDRLRALDALYRGQIRTIASSVHAIEEACIDADLVIGAVLVVGARAPHLVSDALVSRMRPGSVLVDIAIDQGGCFESSRPTTHSDPTFAIDGSIFYCVANMPGSVPHTSTHGLTNVTLPYATAIANHGWKAAVAENPALARGVNTTGGMVVSDPVGAAHGLEVTPLAALLG
jgi:alanine dehydrogenase